jgi:hypothetical protein
VTLTINGTDNAQIAMEAGGSPQGFYYSSSTSALTVANASSSTVFSVADTGAITMPSISSGGTGDDYLCWNSSAGNVTESTSCSLSSIKIKQNVEDLDDGLDQVLAMRPVSYELKPEYNKLKLGRQIGFVAEEMEKIDTRLTTKDENKDILGIRYDKISAVLVKAIQEQQTEIQELKSEIQELKNRK